MKIGIVTGASSGMGKEFVKLMDKKLNTLDEIWVIARRGERLKELSREVKIRLVPIEMDLTKDDELLVLKYLLKEHRPQVKLLINCAGYGKIGRGLTVPYEDQIGMVRLNCLALTAITYTVLPYMSNNSRIIQLASAASFVPQPGFSVYAATKSYVLSFSRSLNEELKDKKIAVTAVCPGPVNTEFFDIAEEQASIPFYKKLVMAAPQKVVEKAFFDSIRGRDVSVYGLSMNVLKVICKLLPHRLIIKFL